ncbi:hypothetical protein BDW68DRAFT_124872 [Aspergillus falconensis]
MGYGVVLSCQWRDRQTMRVPCDLGLRFLTDYFNTTIILIIACYFIVKAFESDQIGSIGNLYELLKSAAQRHPVSGNQDGTYLTMTSKDVSPLASAAR